MTASHVTSILHTCDYYNVCNQEFIVFPTIIARRTLSLALEDWAGFAVLGTRNCSLRRAP